MLSIIVPVYNSGKLLNRCLESIVTQTYTDIEIILVNDYSSDRKTNDLVKKWSLKDSRIVLIENNNNEGIEKARFTGLEHVSGDFITFVDHDDWFFSNDSLEVMMRNIEETNADVVMGRSLDWRAGIKTRLYDPTPSGVVCQPQLKDIYYKSFFGENLIPVLVWAKIYRKSVISKANMMPRGLRTTDDVNFNMWLFPFVYRFSVIDEYVYVHRHGGLSSKMGEFIPEYKKLYKLRLIAMKLFDYEAAFMIMNIQMKNLLCFDLQQKYYRLKYSKAQLLEYLEKELMDDIWKKVASHNDDTPFAKALYNEDRESLYNIAITPLLTPRSMIVRSMKNIFRPLFNGLLKRL